MTKRYQENCYDLATDSLDLMTNKSIKIHHSVKAALAFYVNVEFVWVFILETDNI